jgi:hypothetical protein
MRRIAAALLVTPFLFLAAPAPAAEAGAKTDIALGLASFAVFNQVVAPLLLPRPAHATVVRREVVYVHTPPPVVYAPPPRVVYGPPVPPPPRVVHYPHGRYELHQRGHRYAWVWIPAVVAPPPPPPPY